jgi:hypothetical protein
MDEEVRPPKPMIRMAFDENGLDYIGIRADTPAIYERSQAIREAVEYVLPEFKRLFHEAMSRQG